MIVTETKNGIVHIYSDEGRKIRQNDTGIVFRNAYEPIDGRKHEYEEVEDE